LHLIIWLYCLPISIHRPTCLRQIDLNVLINVRINSFLHKHKKRLLTVFFCSRNSKSQICLEDWIVLKHLLLRPLNIRGELRLHSLFKKLQSIYLSFSLSLSLSHTHTFSLSLSLSLFLSTLLFFRRKKLIIPLMFE